MKLKRILILNLIIFTVCFSQNNYLNISFTDGSNISYALQNIKDIDFTGITAIESCEQREHLAKTFQVFQNYPNPFNPATTIEFALPEPGFVVISIYDLKGGLIKKLLKQKMDPGKYKIIWQGKNSSGQKVSNGIYFYTIRYNKTIITQKMMLIK